MSDIKTSIRSAAVNAQDAYKHSRVVKWWERVAHDYLDNSTIEITPLTSEQKSQVDSLYEKYYGKKISYYYHELYSSVNGVFDPTYIPLWLYYSDVEYYLNTNTEYNAAIEDKNLCALYAKAAGVKTPGTVWGNVDGLNIDGEGKILSKSDLVDAIGNQKSVFVKPSVDSCGGSGCKLFSKVDFENFTAMLQKLLCIFIGSFCCDRNY